MSDDAWSNNLDFYKESLEEFWIDKLLLMLSILHFEFKDDICDQSILQKGWNI